VLAQGLRSGVPFKHEKFVAKVREENPHHFREGEWVEDAVPGQTRKVQNDWIAMLTDLVFRGKLGSRLLILTDRNLYLAATGMFYPWKIKEVRTSYPRSEAGGHLRAESQLAVVVDGERIVVPLPQEKHLTELVKAAGGAEWTAADELREIRATHPGRVLVAVVLAVLAVVLLHFSPVLVTAIAAGVFLLLFALDHVREGRR
jgi:hypothetical protein